MSDNKYVDASVLKNFQDVSIDDLVLQIGQHRRAIEYSYKAYVDFVSYIAKIFNIPAERREEAVKKSIIMLPNVWKNLAIAKAKNSMVTSEYTTDVNKIDAKKLHPLTWKRLQYVITGNKAFESYLDTANPADMKKTPIGMDGFGDLGWGPVLAGIAIVSIAVIYVVGRASTAYETGKKEETHQYLAYERIRDKEIADSQQARQQIIDKMKELFDGIEANIEKMAVTESEKNRLKKEAAEAYMAKLLGIPIVQSSATTAPSGDKKSLFTGVDWGSLGKYLVIATGIVAGTYVAGQVLGIVDKRTAKKEMAHA